MERKSGSEHLQLPAHRSRRLCCTLKALRWSPNRAASADATLIWPTLPDWY
jgi:hypothetical protein